MTFILLVILIASLFFIGMIILLVWAVKRDNSKLDKVVKKAEAILEKNPIIGVIEKSVHAPNIKVSESSVLILDKDIAIHNYLSNPEELWVTFSLKRKLKVNQSFGIGGVVLNVQGSDYESTLTLLFEKVPTHLAPPYGNRYFNLEGERSLNLNGNIENFHFHSRFNFNLSKSNIQDSDALKVIVSIGDKQHSEKISLERIFSETRYQKITQCQEDINWIA